MIRLVILVAITLTACTCGDNTPVVTSHPGPTNTEVYPPGGATDAGVDAFVPFCSDVDCAPNMIACGYNDYDAGTILYPEICDCQTTSGATVHCRG